MALPLAVRAGSIPSGEAADGGAGSSPVTYASERNTKAKGMPAGGGDGALTEGTGENAFVLSGADRPTAGSSLSVSCTEGEMSQFVCKWTRGDVFGNFNESEELSHNPRYVISDDDDEHWLRVTVSKGTGKTLWTKDIWISRLPVVYVDTDDGNPPMTKTDYVAANLRIQGNADYEEQYSGTIQIRGRGNSSWTGYPQKPYKLKLDKKKNLFGFGKSKHWVLISNFNDKCALRNYTASQIAKQLGIIGMNMTWVDVVLNGEVKGCYMLSQHVRVEGSSVDIFDWEEEAEDVADGLFNAIAGEGNWNDMTADDMKELEETMVRGMSWVTDGNVAYRGKTYSLADYDLKADYDIGRGYLFEATENHGSKTQFTTQGGVHFKIDTPEYLFSNTEMMNYVTGFWNDFEHEYSRRPPVDGKNFSAFADMESMVGIWLVNEVMGQGDPTNSRFSYLDNNGILHFGPAWDFDHSSACWTTSSSMTAFCTFSHDRDYIYFRKWFPDPVLCQMAFDAWWDTLRPFLTEYLEDGGDLNARHALSADAGRTNDILWGDYPSQLHPSAKPRTAEEDYDRFREFLLGHVNWLDRQFQSVETLIDAMNARCVYPYEEAYEARKVIQDKKLYIIQGGKWYTIDGKRAK